MKIRRFANTLLCISLSAVAAIVFSGCKNFEEAPSLEASDTVSITESISGAAETSSPAQAETAETALQTQSEETTAAEAETQTETDAPSQTTEAEITEAETTLSETAESVQTAASAAAESAPPEETTAKATETAAPETTAEKPSVEKEGSYTTPEDVAEYIHTFGTLPNNFITKSDAKALGWDSSKGNLWDVAEGKSIGGDRFGNYEGLLPQADGRKYTECDVNYNGGFRGGERIVFSNDGLIYYTNDHYQSFTQLY